MTTEARRLIFLLKNYRRRTGRTQTALSSQLGVDQKTVSRWERGQDLPSIRHQRSIRDLVRKDITGRADTAILARVRMALWPTTLVRRGAHFIEISKSADKLLGMTARGLKGVSIYGKFGSEVDEVTKDWESGGVFEGEIAFASSVNKLPQKNGELGYIRSLDYPHYSSDGQIWCVCELKEIGISEYDEFLKQYGSRTFSVDYEQIVDS